MAVGSVFKTAVRGESPFDGSGATTPAGTTGATTANGDRREVSDFLSVQSVANFAVISVAITAAWNALQLLGWQFFSTYWVPLVLALVWGLISILMSWDDLLKNVSGRAKLGTILQAFFIATINALVLFSAVVGAGSATRPTP